MKRRKLPPTPTPRVHSASGISLAKRCRRAWALKYIDGLKPEDVSWAEIVKAEAEISSGLRHYSKHPCFGAAGAKGAALGKEVHERAERYLGHGPHGIKWDDVPGQVLRELIDLLPAAGTVPAENIEHEFEVELCGVVWKGLIDLYAYTTGSALRVSRPVDFASPGVWDHKTTRDIMAYALLPHDASVELAAEFPAPELGFAARSIRADLQACMYVLYTSVRRAMRPEQTVPVRWNYTETQKVRRSLRVVDNIRVLDARAVVAEAAAVAKQCDTYRTSLEAPADTLSCGDYGGCWYRGRHCREIRDYGRLLDRLQTTGRV